jgi:hypothetical protein
VALSVRRRVGNQGAAAFAARYALGRASAPMQLAAKEPVSTAADEPLKVSSPHDLAEHEATASAAAVMRMTAPAGAVAEESTTPSENPHAALPVQRRLGNQAAAFAARYALGRASAPMQLAAKEPVSTPADEPLKVSSPHDLAEHEATASAAAVMRMTAPAGAVAEESTTPSENPHAALPVQRRLGNHAAAFAARYALGAAGAPIQLAAKEPVLSAADQPLMVSSPHDPAEREATATAVAVMRMTAPAGAVAEESATPQIHRQAAGPASDAHGAADQIHGAMSAGTPLPQGVRNFMEPRFGAEFGHVRIHTGEQAAGLSRQLDAQAFTVGSHIFFGRGQYRPERSDGQELIAHELTHTLQQGGNGHSVRRSPAIQRQDAPQAPPQPDDEKRSWWSSLLDFGEQAGWKLLREVAPGLVPIIQKGPEGAFDWLKERATAALEGVFNTVMAPVRAISGVGQQLSAQFQPLLARAQIAAGQIARNDCTPLREAAEKIEKAAEELITPVIAKLQPVVAKIKDLLNTLWDKIGAPIWDLIKQYAAFQWDEVQWLWQKIKDISSWIWEKTAWIRSLAAKAWTWVKNKLGIGEGAEGQDGLLQWVQRKLGSAWDWIKAKLEPFKKEITAVLTAIGAVALALSPAGPILAIGAAVGGAIQGLRWIAANWGKGNLIVQARVYLEKTLIPPLVAAANRLSAVITHMAAVIAGALGDVAAAITRAAGALGGSLLQFAVSAIQWVADQAVALAAWAQQELGQVAHWLTGALARLQSFLEQMLEFFAKVGKVILDIYGLPILLAEKVWNWVPACIRDPIVDFIGPIILQQIELFRELGKDNEAWQRTKADIANLIRLVFKDHDLVGAVKAAFHLVLRVFNLPPDLLVTVANKAVASWDIVSKKPLDFIKNTVHSIARGFKLLWHRIEFHLEFGLKEWLLGELAEVRPPKSWTDPKDVFFFVLEVLGLSIEHLFELLAKRFDKDKIARLRVWYGRIGRALDWIHKTIDINKTPEENTKGLIAQAKDFGKTILKGLVGWVVKKVAAEVAIVAVSAALTAGLSEIIDIARRIYKALVTAKRWARRLVDMANEALDNVLDIASGAIEKVGIKFEDILHRGMPVVIGFLADQVGLGGVGEQIRSIVDDLRAQVDAGILWLIDKVKAGLEAVIGAVKAGVAAVFEWWKARMRVGEGESSHTIYFVGDEESAVLFIESTPTALAAYISALKGDPQYASGDQIQIIQRIEKRLGEIETLRVELRAAKDRGHVNVVETKRNAISTGFEYVGKQLGQLFAGDTYGTEANPIPLAWPGPSSDRYPTLVFGGRLPVTSRPKRQSTLRGIMSRGQKDETGTLITEYSAHKLATLPGGGRIGLSDEFFLRVGQIVGPLSQETTKGGEKLQILIEPYGFSAELDGLQLDHVHEIQFGGLAQNDQVENLWPLERFKNLRKGSVLSNAKVEYPKGQITAIPIVKTIQNSDVKKKKKFFFRITSVE